jgi:hypothetical protein
MTIYYNTTITKKLTKEECRAIAALIAIAMNTDSLCTATTFQGVNPYELIELFENNT